MLSYQILDEGSTEHEYVLRYSDKHFESKILLSKLNYTNHAQPLS